MQDKYKGPTIVVSLLIVIVGVLLLILSHEHTTVTLICETPQGVTYTTTGSSC